MAHEKKCIVCGTQYKYCSHCSEYNSEETWRHLYCSSNCRKIYDLFLRVRDGVIDRGTAKKELKNFDLSNLENFSNQVKPVIESLMKDERPEKEELSNLEVEIDDTVSADKEVEVEAKTEEKPEPKFFYKKNKNK